MSRRISQSYFLIQELRCKLLAEVSESNEDFEHPLSQNAELLFLYVVVYFLAEAQLLVLSSPYFFQSKTSGKFIILLFYLNPILKIGFIVDLGNVLFKRFCSYIILGIYLVTDFPFILKVLYILVLGSLTYLIMCKYYIICSF